MGQLQRLLEASAALLESPEPQHIQNAILRLAREFVAADAHALWLARGGEWELAASAGLSKKLAGLLPFRSAAEPVVIEDAGHPMLAVPLNFHGATTGMLVFHYRAPHAFSETEIHTAKALGVLASPALAIAGMHEQQAKLREIADDAERRTGLLAGSGDLLASSLDYEATLRSVARLAVPHFADWCTVDLEDEDGNLQRLAVELDDPLKAEFSRDYRRRFPPDENHLSRVTLRSGKSLLVPEITDDRLKAGIADPEQLELLRSLGLTSVICAPMLVRGRALGVITFVTSDSGRNYRPSDLGMAEEIARRAALAIENARLFKEVRESEERFRRLYDTNLVGVAFWHVDGYITEANDKYLSLLGIDRDELRTPARLRWEHATPDEWHEVDEQIVRECLESGASGTYEKEYRHKDGTRVPVLIAAAFLPSSKENGIAFVVDITHSKRLERQFKGVAEAAVRINAAQSAGQVLRILEEQAGLLTGAARSFAGLGDTAIAETGEFSTPLKERNGKIIGALRLYHRSSNALTEADRAVAIQLAEMASIAIENLTLQSFLLQSNEELRRANEDLNQFAYSASHDLQEPLRMIAIYTQLLSRRFGAQLDADAHEYMKYTLDGALRMETLLRDLLTYTQSVSIRGIPDRPADTENALRRALANLQPSISAAGAVITSGNLPKVRAYDTHLVQLFQNLVSNALKYRSTATPAIQIEAKWDPARRMWLFSVRDNGVGIDAEYHKQVFGLFKRLHAAHEHPGTGIGLAICQKVVERYGGEIWVESNEDGGSTFYFTLPPS